MKFYKILDEKLENNNVDLYVDLDGVVAEYDIGNFDYNTIRPLLSTIKKLEKLSLNKKLNIYILSICKTNLVVEEKKIWISKHLPFLKKDNIILISKENIDNKNYSSKELKSNYLKKNVNSENEIFVIDDDNDIIKYLRVNNDRIVVFQDSSLID